MTVARISPTPRERLQELQFLAFRESILHSLFEQFDLMLCQVELLQQLLDGESRIGWQEYDTCLHQFASTLSKDVGCPFNTQTILGQLRMNTVFQSGSFAAEDHASAGEISEITNFARRNPYCRQGTASVKAVQSMAVKSIGLIHTRHHQLCFSGVYQLGQHASLFNLIDDPVPIADRFDGNRGSTLPVPKELAE